MNNWTIMAPYARVTFSGDQLEEFNKSLDLLPGVKLKRGFWEVPANALVRVAELQRRFGVGTDRINWVIAPEISTDWPAIEAHLVKAGVREEYLGSWPREFQRSAVTFGWNKTGFHLWHSTGAGKTWTAIVSSLRADGPVVVVTLSAVRGQFAREIGRFVKTRAYVLRAKSKTRMSKTVNGQTWVQFISENMPKVGKLSEVSRLWQVAKETYGVKTVPVSQTLDEYLVERRSRGERPFIVVGWEALVTHLPVLLKINPDAVIYDELHLGKGAKRWSCVPLGELPEDPKEASKQQRAEYNEYKVKGGFIKGTLDGRKAFLPEMNRAAAAATLSRKVSLRIGATATPISDRVRDLWGQLDTIEPNAWGNKSKWQDRYCDAHPGSYGGIDTTGSSHLAELNQRLKGITHIVPAQEAMKHLLHLKRRQSVYIAPEDLCRPAPGFAKEAKEAMKRGPSALVEVKLALAASKKRKAALGLIETCVGSKQKVLVFTARRRDCDDITKSVKNSKKVKGVSAWSAHGGLSIEARQEIVDEYMEHPGPCVLVATGQSLGTGFDLDDTDAMLFVMLPYTPGQLRQWEGRPFRLSMKRAVVIYYVIAEGTIDEHIASILIDKLPSVEDVANDKELGAAKGVLSGIDENETEDDFAAAILADLDF